jgi:hypothetical protein
MQNIAVLNCDALIETDPSVITQNTESRLAYNNTLVQQMGGNVTHLQTEHQDIISSHELDLSSYTDQIMAIISMEKDCFFTPECDPEKGTLYNEFNKMGGFLTIHWIVELELDTTLNLLKDAANDMRLEIESAAFEFWVFLRHRIEERRVDRFHQILDQRLLLGEQILFMVSHYESNGLDLAFSELKIRKFLLLYSFLIDKFL